MFARITARVQLIGLLSQFSVVTDYGIRVPRNETLPTLVRHQNLFNGVGQLTTMTVVSIQDLIPGDVIECWMRPQNFNAWALVPQGFTVLVG
jgi:hypothetical protein